MNRLWFVFAVGMLSVDCNKPSSRASDGEQAAALAEFEAKIQGVAAKVLPAVVAVRGPRPADKAGPVLPRDYSSGVIVTEDGVIASQYHVSHRTPERNWGGVVPKGTKTVVVFADGTEAEAELLGADLFNDLSLLKLSKPGKYPFVALEGPAPRLGDSVLKIGHPDGYFPGRAPPVRLGRVVSTADAVFVTDCPIVGGDSGGPYFDLDGRLVGIIRSSTVPLSVYGASGASRARGVIPFSVTPTATVRARFEGMRQGEVFGDLISESDEAKQFDAAIQTAKSLPSSCWSQGTDTLVAWAGAIADARLTVVGIVDGEEAIALGTVVEDGFVLTKASPLPDIPACRLPGGEVVAAEVVGVDPEFDLALLRIKTEGLKPIRWAAADPRVGSLLAAPGPGKVPLATGVLSVSRRDVKVIAPKTLARRSRAPAALPAVLGSGVADRGYWVEYVGGAAAAADIRPGDVIVTIGSTPIREHSDLAAAVTDRFAGERLPVALLREGKTVAVSLPLTGFGSGLLNGRFEGFPTSFEFDIPLVASECGGPIVGLDGLAVGVTLARSGATGCQAVPADVVRKLLPNLKAGKPLATLPPLPTVLRAGPAVAAVGKPVGVGLDEVKERLGERGDAFRSAFVEYETSTRSIIDPRLAASWGIGVLRDSTELHQFAFDGANRLSATTRPGVSAYAVPPTEVVPAPGAPPDVVRQIEASSRFAAANEQATGIAPWFLGVSKEPIRSRSLFDGKDAYIQLPGMPRMGKADAALFVSNPEYLTGLGLRPVDPKPLEAVQKAQAGLWFPGNFAGYTEARLRPRMETVDGADCVVIEAVSAGDGRQKTTETLWLDPAMSYAPRRWEMRADGVLVTRRTNARFEEFAPGCWLPWESEVETGPPGWVPKEDHDRPIYRMTIRLKRAVVNQPKAEWFQP
jgi:serine protease Do